MSRSRANRLLIAVASLPAILAPSPALANRFRDNPDRVVNRETETWASAIGEVVSNRETTVDGRTGHLQGTAFLVSPCYVLTAAHVVYGRNTIPSAGADYSMQFWLGTGDRHGFSTSFTATPDLNYARWWNDEDWALLKLPNDKCIGLHPSIGWYEPSSKEINLSDRYASAGFSSLEARGTLTIGQGRAYPRPGHHLNNSYYFSGSMAEGSSGGPVFSVEEGVLRIVAINLSQLSAPQSQSVLRYSDRFANIIKPMNKVFLDPSVKALLEADKARFNKPNPAAERLRMDHLPQ